MTTPIKAVVILMAGVFVTSGAIAAPCSTPLNTSVEVNVQEAPIIIARDITLADLRAISARLQRPPPHAVLGFYVGTVGRTEYRGTGSAIGQQPGVFRRPA